ncbi:MarR family winged helix-turn-helix transcriptional regulator [Sphingomonas aracearum]|uniref:MarR family transcriptional regulator n=1 Tax=Sphingomonas aracearum TaxID=2283317 RepID=A0A369VU54_9SPHN|nr:MarR family transcriptional regulator [Sphingomonas aracearum]RDE04602.1 MarR family transcriptional regulator [Sphingomonas aracearum]
MPAPRPLDEQLCFSLYAASMAVGRAYKPLLDRLGLTYPQYLVLHTLWEAPEGRSIGAIGERLGLESSTVTPLVKRMEAAGLVTRARNPADERQVRVRLTDAGTDLRERCGCLGEMLLERAGFDVSSLARLNADVQRLRDALARPEGLDPAAA